MAKILIIDDLDKDSGTAVKILEKANHDIIIARTGEEGLEVTISEKPDLILMDIVLPGISGFQTTRKISKHPETKGIPIVILSSKGTETDKVWGLRQGAMDYLVKPVTEKTLLPLINKLVK